MRKTGLFADLNEQDFGVIHSPIDRLAYASGATVYEEGCSAKGVFCVHSGMLKLVRSTVDGHQRIVRVLKPGDVGGLEALGTAGYDCQAVALTEVLVCRIPLSVVHILSTSSPRLHRTLMQKWRQALKDADDWLADLNFGSARQRVAQLVLKMRSAQDAQLVTLFAREDMGAMLDLKFETVSREISALVREKVLLPLDKQGRIYRLLEPQRLLAPVPKPLPG
jgi:CRP-like cAMP-binding protein